MSIPILQISNLSYAYSENKTVLSNVTLDIFEGEKIVVLGSNGAGKSTFFLMLNGVLIPDKGEIFYRKKEIRKKNLNELRKNIGIVFQEADNQLIASTVLAEVSFGPMNLKLPKKEVERRVEKALDYMNISDFKNRPPHYLSGGEKKKVSIADIIAMQTEIIIFDEPTASLDPFNVAVLEKVLHKLEQENKTILISTHDVDFAYQWAQRVIVFCDGTILADGTPLEIFCNKELIKKANLRRPYLLDIYEMMTENNMIKQKACYPKNLFEFEAMLSIQKNT